MCRIVLALLLAPAGSFAAVTSSQTDRAITMDNGIVALEISRATGTVTSIRYTSGGTTHQIASGPESMYWDSNADVIDVTVQPGERAPNKGYYRPGNSRQSCELAISSPQRAEVVVKAGPSRWFAFQVEYHITLFDGDSGYYSYVVFHHRSDSPAAKLWQTRFVHKLNLKDQFETWVVDDDQISSIPTSAVAAKVMDATFQLEDGTVKTKYANSVYWAAAMVYGVVGKQVGIWSISASPEYHNGGPVKQGQTVHDNVLLRVMQSSHFGASGVDVAAGEDWQKVYGPVFTYLNSGASVPEMWADAKSRQKDEAAKWPYQWVDSPAYQKPRGRLSGQWKLSGSTSATQGAWVILSAAGGDWAAQGKGYNFFVRSGPDGKFDIPNVIPGTYSLYIVGADQPEQFSKDDVAVSADHTTDVGTLEWTPQTHGRTLWQLGVFDRSAGEFRNGDDARHFEMFRRYPEQFPEDVTFVIGKSDPKKDWNYAQWSWYCKSPEWKLQFEMPDAPKTGKATLTIGIASAQPISGKLTDVQVKVNGTAVDSIRLPKTGTAGYRGGAQDSPYHVKYITFDASLLRPGANQITFAHTNATPFPKLGENVEFNVGQVMYDAIRLEVAR